MKFLLLSLLLVPVAAWAHDPGMSAATVDFGSREILVQVSFAHADLGGLGATNYAALASQSVELRARNAALQPTASEVREVGTDHVEFTLRFPRPVGDAVLRSRLLARLPLGHRQVLAIRDLEGTPLRTELLSADHDSVALPDLAIKPSYFLRGARLRGATLAVICAFAFASIWLVRRPRSRRLA